LHGDSTGSPLPDEALQPPAVPMLRVLAVPFCEVAENGR